MGFKQDDRIGGFLPVVGFIMLIVLGVIAYALSPQVITLVRANVPSLRGVAYQTLQIGATLVTFVILAMVGAGVVAIFAPKPKVQARDADLIKERKDKLEEKARAKRRQRNVNRQMRNM